MAATTSSAQRTSTSAEVGGISDEVWGTSAEVEVTHTSGKGEVRGATVILNPEAANQLAKWASHYYPHNPPQPGRIAEEMIAMADRLRAADAQRTETPAQRADRLTGKNS